MQAHPFVVRDALPDEIDAAGEVVRAAYRQFEADYPAGHWQRFIHAVGDLRPRLDYGQVIVAVQDDSLLGSITYYPDASQSGQGDWPAGAAGAVRLGVVPEARGLGVGRALIDECINRTRLLGRTTIALHTTEWMSVARAMYERMGFVRVPEFDFKPPTGIVGFGYRLDL